MNSPWSNENIIHRPVLVKEVIGFLNVQPDGVYLDGTIGLGGHAAAIQARLSERAVLVGFDGDEEAIGRCQNLLSASSTCHLVHDSYHNFPEHLEYLGIREIDGMFLDLGISSLQLDSPERGFSYRLDGPLDMRFDRRQEVSAADIVNQWDETKLRRIFREYGEERMARRIAEAIVQNRRSQSIASTLGLRDIVRSVVPRRYLNKSLSRIFQALRIAVNGELRSLQEFMDRFIHYLRIGGRMVAISYHSLEDRIVKRKLRDLARGCICPPEVPICQCGQKPSVRILTPRPITPEETEVQQNPRARSAKLRAAEKI